MVTLLPDEDQTPDPDVDVDPSTPTLWPTSLTSVDNTIREAVEAVESEVRRLRAQRAEQDRTGLETIERMRRGLIEERRKINDRIKALVAEQVRLRRLVRVLDRK